MKELKQSIEEGLYFLEITATNTFNNKEQEYLSEKHAFHNRGYYAGYMSACKDFKVEVIDPIFSRRTTPLRFNLNTSIGTDNRLKHSLESLVDEFKQRNYSISEICELIKSSEVKSMSDENLTNPGSLSTL